MNAINECFEEREAILHELEKAELHLEYRDFIHKARVFNRYYYNAVNKRNKSILDVV